MCIRKKEKPQPKPLVARESPAPIQPRAITPRESVISQTSTDRRNGPSTITDEEKTQKEYEQRLNEVYLAIGATPNDVLAKRLTQRRQVQQNQNNKAVGGENLEKFGDITFSYRSSQMSMIDDVDDFTQSQNDTEYELPKTKIGKASSKPAKQSKQSKQSREKTNLSKESGKKSSNSRSKGTVYKSAPKKKKIGKYSYKRSSDGINKEDLDGTLFDPEVNFMANLDDMEFVARDLMRTMKKKQIEHLLAQTQQNANSVVDTTARFSKKVLRANTFLSNALSLPTHEERENMITAKEHMCKVIWVDPPSIEIANFRPDDDIVITANLMTDDLLTADAK